MFKKRLNASSNEMVKERLRKLRAFVYVYGGDFREAGLSLYKIGYSKNPVRRVASWPLMPWRCSFVATIPTYQPRKVEDYLHRLFAGKRLRGEWFILSEEDIESIRAHQCLQEARQ